MLLIPAHAMEFEAPAAPPPVRAAVEQPADSFGEGLWNVARFALRKLDPSLDRACRSLLGVCMAVLACGMLRQMTSGTAAGVLDLGAAALAAGALLGPSLSLLRLGEQTVRQLNDYGKLLLPVMTGALAAQGGVTASASLYAAAALFNALLSEAITRVMIPGIYLYLALSIGAAVTGEALLRGLRDLLQWMTGWVLKGSLYLFTGFLAVTGIVSGTADAAAVKAAKLTISGAVPVVGSILADAAETVLVGAGLMRSAAGIYGLLTVLALCLTPYLQTGLQYLLLKAVSAFSASLDSGKTAELLGDFSAAMGMLMGMIGTQTVLLLVSTVCFMKGAG